MEQYIDPGIGPLEVTKDLRALGIENTFLAGHFRPGSPLLFRYETPSNLRVDVNFELDPYNQTTLSDMGSILTDIYQCSQNGGSALSAVFPDEITQNECEQMIAFLIGNKTPLLINAGLPDGTPIAHKHGWVTDFNTTAIRTIGDAGIIFTPAGDYILVIYFSHPIQLVWDPVSTLISNISTAIYNYFNIPSQ